MYTSRSQGLWIIIIQDSFVYTDNCQLESVLLYWNTMMYATPGKILEGEKLVNLADRKLFPKFYLSFQNQFSYIAYICISFQNQFSYIAYICSSFANILPFIRFALTHFSMFYPSKIHMWYLAIFVGGYYASVYITGSYVCVYFLAQNVCKSNFKQLQ